jgi:hypothetical protein
MKSNVGEITMKWTLLLLFVLLPILAAAQTELEYIGQIFPQDRIEVSEAIVADNLVFFGGQSWGAVNYDGISIGCLIRSDQDSLSIASSYFLEDGGFLNSIAWSYPYLFAVVTVTGDDRPNTLYKFDFRDPHNPILIGKRHLVYPDNISTLVVVNNVLYAISSNRILIFSAFDDTFSLLSSFDGIFESDAFVINNYLLLCGRNITTYGIGNPLYPSFINQIEVGNVHNQFVHHGNYLYSTTSDETLSIYDVTFPANVQLIDTITTPHDYLSSMVTTGDRLYIRKSWSSYILIYDIANPSQPEFLNETYLGFSSRITNWNEHELLQFNNPGHFASIIDFEDFNNPDLVSPLAQITEHTYQRAFQMQEDFMVVTNSQGVVLFDLTDPLKPVQASSVSELFNVYQVALNGDYMYANNGQQHFFIVDVSDIYNPVILHDEYVNREGGAMVLYDDTLVLAGTYTRQMFFFDISDSLNPEQITFIQERAEFLFHQEPYLLAIAWQGQNRVSSVDVTDVQNPFVADSEGIQTTLYQPDYKDSLLAVPGWDSGFRLIDTRDPTDLVIYSNVSIPSDTVYSMSLMDHYAAVGSSDGVRVYDVVDPSAPILVGEHETDNFVTHVHLFENGILYASDLHNIHILNATNILNLSPPVTNLSAELIDDSGNFRLTWSPPVIDPAPQSYRVYQNGEELTTVSDSVYTSQLPIWGNYEFSVRAEHEDGVSIAEHTSLSWQAPIEIVVNRLEGRVIPIDGGNVWLDAEVTSNLPQPVTVDLRLVAIHPSGYTRILRIEPVELFPGIPVNYENVRVHVPQQTPGGTYRIRAAALSDDGELQGVDRIEFTKLGLPSGGNRLLEDWVVTGFEQPEIDVVSITQDDGLTSLSIHPNPFNAVATIDIQLPVTGDLSIAVYNITGRQVINVEKTFIPAGLHRYVLDGSNLASGIYFVHVNSPDLLDATRKILLVK